jgi:hypothetical protein
MILRKVLAGSMEAPAHTPFHKPVNGVNPIEWRATKTEKEAGRK